MDELSRWFGLLEERLGPELAPSGLGPKGEETKLLLEIGKVVAEGSPQRFFALLTAFWVGRLLGRAEERAPDLEPVSFLRRAKEGIEGIAR